MPPRDIGRELAGRGIATLDPRGETFSAAADPDSPAARDLLDSVRALAVGDRGPSPYDGRARRRFAAALDPSRPPGERVRDKHGLTLGAFVRRLRLEWSADRLTRSADSLSSIAYEAGFADQSHFTRAFKRYTGLPPGAYRRAKA